MEDTIYDYNKIPPIWLTNYTKQKDASENQIKNLLNIIPLIDSNDDESILLGIGYLKEEGWCSSVITSDGIQFSYSIVDLVRRIELGWMGFAVILAVQLSAIVKSKMYCEHTMYYED